MKKSLTIQGREHRCIHINKLSTMEIQKKDIIYVTTPERAENYRYEPKYLEVGQLPANVEVVSIMDLKANRDIKIPRNLICESILIRKPYDIYSYIKLEDYIGRNYISEKWKAICSITNHLGMKYMKANYTKNTKDNSCINGGVGVNCTNGLNVNGGVQYNNEIITYEGIQLERRGDSKNKLTESSFQVALDLATRADLLEDSFVKNLLDDRNPKNENHQNYFKDTLTFEINQNLIVDSVAKINGLGIFDFNLNYKKDEVKTINESFLICIDFENDHRNEMNVANPQAEDK